jgi:hypothetical protein
MFDTHLLWQRDAQESTLVYKGPKWASVQMVMRSLPEDVTCDYAFAAMRERGNETSLVLMYAVDYGYRNDAFLGNPHWKVRTDLKHLGLARSLLIGEGAPQHHIDELLESLVRTAQLDETLQKGL